MLKDGTRAKCQVKKGDKVLFSSYGGTEVKLGIEEYLLIDETDILAILD
jgi:chaperonin GroES